MTPPVMQLYILAIWRQTINEKTIEIFQIVTRAMRTINR